MHKKAAAQLPQVVTQAIGTISMQMDALEGVLQTPEEQELLTRALQAYDNLAVSLAKLYRNVGQRGHAASKKAGLSEFDKEMLIEHFRNLSPEEIVDEIEHFAPGALQAWANGYAENAAPDERRMAKKASEVYTVASLQKLVESIADKNKPVLVSLSTGFEFEIWETWDAPDGLNITVEPQGWTIKDWAKTAGGDFQARNPRAEKRLKKLFFNLIWNDGVHYEDILEVLNEVRSNPPEGEFAPGHMSATKPRKTAAKDDNDLRALFSNLMENDVEYDDILEILNEVRSKLPSGKQQHAGTVCSECGRTITQDEYSVGESKCCQAPVFGEEQFGRY